MQWWKIDSLSKLASQEQAEHLTIPTAHDVVLLLLRLSMQIKLPLIRAWLGIFTESQSQSEPKSKSNSKNRKLTIAIKASELVLGNARIGLLVGTGSAVAVAIGASAILRLEAELVCDLYGLHEKYVIIHRGHIPSLACADHELGWGR